MYKIQSQIRNILLFLIYSLALFPVLPRGVESVLMILVFLVSAIYFIKFQSRKLDKNQIFKVLTFSVLFFLYLISLAYSSELKSGLNYLVKVIPIILFPIIFGLFAPDLLMAKNVNHILKIYTSSIFIGLCYIHLHLYFTTSGKALTNWEYRNAFEALTDVHGTYFSIWIGFGLFIILLKLLKLINRRKFTYSIILICVGAYLFYWQLIIGARLPQVMTIILLSIALFLHIKKGRHRVLGGVGLAILVSSIFIFNPNFLQRMKSLTAYDFSFPVGNYESNYETITNEQIRNGIYYCSFSLIKDAWVFGYGIGDVNHTLLHCYDQKLESNVYDKFKYNSHNHYFHVWLASGIVGLLFFLFSLGYSIYLACISKNRLYIMFSVFIVFTLLTENVLSRHDGVLFYSYFNAIFAFNKFTGRD